MKKTYIIFLVIFVAIGIAIFALNKNNQDGLPSKPDLTVVASFYPLAEFSKQVGGNEVEIINIVPPGVKAHDFEPTPQDIVKAYSAKLFVFNGGGFDPWAEKIAPELVKRGIAVIQMTEHFELLKSEDAHKNEEDTHKEEEDEKHKKKDLDPHIWLDPVLAKKQVEIIRDALISIDPENSHIYTSNARQYLEALRELDEKYQTGLSLCVRRDIVTSHAAFAYLAKRYNINMIPIAGFSPKEEPSPKRIAEIADLAREKNIQYIFFETLVSPKLAETIANEIGVQTLILNPIEGLTEKEIQEGKNYISVMEENLANLRKALLCQ